MLSAVYTCVHLLPVALAALGPVFGLWALLAALPALALAVALPGPLELVHARRDDSDAQLPSDATLAGIALALLLLLALSLWLAGGGSAAPWLHALATQALAVACLVTLGPRLVPRILLRKSAWLRAFGICLSGAIGLAPKPRPCLLRPRRHEGLAAYLARDTAASWRRGLKQPRATATRLTLALAVLVLAIAIGGGGALALVAVLWLAVRLRVRAAAYLDGYGLDEWPKPDVRWRDSGKIGPAIEAFVLRLGLPADTAAQTIAAHARTASQPPRYPAGRGAMLLMALQGERFFDATDPILRPDLAANDPFSRLEREAPLVQPPPLDGPAPGSPLPPAQPGRATRSTDADPEAALLARLMRDTAPHRRKRPV